MKGKTLVLALLLSGLLASTTALAWAGTSAGDTNLAAQDTMPPTTPTGLKVQLGPGGYTLVVSWDPNPEPDLAGYILYVSEDELTYQARATLGPASTSYTDTNVTQGGVYYYEVSAYDRMLNESPRSLEAVGIVRTVLALAPKIQAGLDDYTPKLSLRAAVDGLADQLRDVRQENERLSNGIEALQAELVDNRTDTARVEHMRTDAALKGVAVFFFFALGCLVSGLLFRKRVPRPDPEGNAE